MMAVCIEPAQYPDDAEVVHKLFSGYATSLGIDLAFQSFQEELNSLPGKYSESHGGALLLARARLGQSNSNVIIDTPTTPKSTHATLQELSNVGCVALRRSTDNWCEMKRLYVVPGARGLRLGDRLVQAILARAKALGYHGVRLDTLPEMTAALSLYRRYGFVEIDAYYNTPVQGTIFMGCTFDGTP